MKKQKWSKKLIIILIILICLGLFGIYIYRYQVVPYFKKVSLTTWLNTPSNTTIYEQNSENAFPKTKITIPKEEGYLIAVYKDQHKLKLLKNNKIEKEYSVNIKREEMDRKIWEDDQTPEGIFYIETMNKVTDPPWSRWMRLNTVKKAHEIYKEAYNNGEELISEFEEEYGKLNTDKNLRKFNQINSKQKILRGIGIHGGGFSMYHEWTQGCIALADKDVIELFEILKQSKNKGIGTKVIIQD